MFSAANFPNTLTPAYTFAPFASVNKMDPSVSVKKEKTKGKSKKNKKEKKDKKEKTKKEKQTVSIDLTSPARAHTPPPGPDAVSNAAHTPTRALSRQNSKSRGRSITQREEAKPASVSDDNNRHTYNSRPLPLFSSNDSTDTPSTSTGTNAVRPRAKSAAAVPDRPRTNDTERSTYSHDCKIKALETCLSLRDRYLDMPPAVQTDQEPFWTQVRTRWSASQSPKASSKTGKRFRGASSLGVNRDDPACVRNDCLPYRNPTPNWMNLSTNGTSSLRNDSAR